MGLMDLLSGGGSDRAGLEDFAQRFDQGSPWDGFDENEAHERYQQVSQHLSPEEFEESARDVFAKLSPQERREAGRMLSQRAREHGVQFGGSDDGDDRFDDPGLLGGLLGGLQSRQPGGLGQLLSAGGGGGGLQKVILGGIAAMATKRMLGR